MVPQEATPNNSGPTREQAKAKLAALREQYGERASALSTENEAKTRLVLVDSILEALGWSRDEFNPEQAAGHIGFTDYLVSADDIPRFIVEAKRTGTTFRHPRSGLKKTEYQLSYIKSSFGPAMSEVIKQAEGYSVETKIPFVVVTNGAEWLLIQAIPYSSQSLDDLRCIYFDNLLSEISNFDLFWELLAKPNVLSGSLENELARLNSMEAEFYAVPGDRLPEFSWNSSLSSKKYIWEFYDYFFDEIIDPGRRRMLDHCFVTNTKLDQYQGDMKRILLDTVPSYLKKDEARNITPEEGFAILSDKSGDQKGRVIIVTGSVGCGKSTLVNKVLVDARKNKKFISLIIDLINEFSGDPKVFTTYLWQEVATEWRQQNPQAYNHKDLCKIFGRELKELREGAEAKLFEQDPQLWVPAEARLLKELSSSPETFLEKSWRYYNRQNNKGVVVFLDNIDRSSEEYQRLVYAFAHKLADKTGATVIITMREVTYFRGKQSGFLDIRSSDKVFHLETPDLVQIISKRLQYIEIQLDANNQGGKDLDHRLREWKRTNDWLEFKKQATKCVEVLKLTFLTSRHAPQHINLLAAIVWHDVRYFLRLLRHLHLMLGSSDPWSISEMIAALMMAVNDVDNQSTLAKLYVPPYPNYPCYFLKPRILLMLLFGKRASEIRRGTSLKFLLSFSRMYRYPDKWTKRAIIQMVRERLLECLEAPSAAEYTKDYELEDHHSFRISPLAVTILEQVQYDYIYLCLLGNELPFQNQKVFDEFIIATKEISSFLAEEALDRESLKLLFDTEAGRIVARYLASAFREEQPLGNATMQMPGIAATEQELKSIVNNMLKIAGDAGNSEPTQSAPLQHKPQPMTLQLELFDSSQYTKPSNSLNIQVPVRLADIRIRTSELAPKIFFALVILGQMKEKFVTGANIANVINQYMVDDLNKVESSNISKALRGETLKSQAWLIKTKAPNSTKKNLYSLSDDWQSHWEEIFKEKPPNFA
jgi:hypothetical protein